MENELRHHGIKGMKWGVRRYQNADGSLTDAGKRRYDRDIAENKAKKKDNRIQIDGPDAKRWVKEDLKRSKNVVDESSRAVKELENIERITRPSKPKVDLSSMSDQELRAQINRIALEKQYMDTVAPQTVSRGRQYAKNLLKYSGEALAITGSALSIALAIKELRG